MDVDRTLHAKKAFIELGGADIELFLRERKFGAESALLEFKSQFTRGKGGKVDVFKFCKYVVGFSNDLGGYLVYGVADAIKDAAVDYPEYVPGLPQGSPSDEALSQWLGFIHPLASALQFRRFDLDKKEVLFVRIPPGAHPPYCYVDPSSKALTFTMKTPSAVRILDPREVAIQFEDAVVRRAERVVQAKERQPSSGRIKLHQESAIAKLEDIETYGHVGIYCRPEREIDVPTEDLRSFMTHHRSDFGESLRYGGKAEVFQGGVSTGYFPSAIRRDIKSTVRTTLYSDGFCALDSQIDNLMDRDQSVHPYWLSYELQRHLQLTKALLEPRGVASVTLELHFGPLEGWNIKFGGNKFTRQTGDYQGAHEPIRRSVLLADVPAHNGSERNVAAESVRDVMDEVSSIFGLSSGLSDLWAEDGSLAYVKGLEHQR